MSTHVPKMPNTVPIMPSTGIARPWIELSMFDVVAEVGTVDIVVAVAADVVVIVVVVVAWDDEQLMRGKRIIAEIITATPEVFITIVKRNLDIFFHLAKIRSKLINKFDYIKGLQQSPHQGSGRPTEGLDFGLQLDHSLYYPM